MASGSEREVIIRVADLKAAYDGQVVLDHINFEVYAGEVLAILGGSGSGKSTLLKHMIGLYQPVAGKVLIDGEDIAAASGAARLKILRKFGVMYQSGALFGSMTLVENVALPLEEFTDLPPEAIRLIALMKLERVGLSGVADRMPSELSGGMQKRGAIAHVVSRRAVGGVGPSYFRGAGSIGLKPGAQLENHFHRGHPRAAEYLHDCGSGNYVG